MSRFGKKPYDGAVRHYEFIVKTSDTPIVELLKLIDKIAKRWSLCIEENTNDKFYRGRLHLNEKVRERGVIGLFGRIVVTVKRITENNFYILPNESLLDGPWSDKQPYSFLSQRFKEMTDWQPSHQQIITNVESTEWTSEINIIVNVDDKRYSKIRDMSIHLLYRKVIKRIPSYLETEDIDYILKLGSPAYLIEEPKHPNTINMKEFLIKVNEIKHTHISADLLTDDDSNLNELAILPLPHVWVFLGSIPSTKYLDESRWRLWILVDSPRGECLEELEIPTVSLK